jgi:hypothetical protein
MQAARKKTVFNAFLFDGCIAQNFSEFYDYCMMAPDQYA